MEEKRMTIYAPMGCLGYGFPEHSLRAAIAKKPDVFALDAGSTDPGPYYLGIGKSYTTRAMVKRDFKLIMEGALEVGCPLIVGTVGGAGAKPHVDWFMEIFNEIVDEIKPKKKLKVALIMADIDRDRIKKAIDDNDIIDFEMNHTLTKEDVDESTNIVGQMGVEPLIEALKNGADIIIAGRAFDAALIAAYPIMKGYDPGLCLHLGKILECGSLIAVPRESDGCLAYLNHTDFIVEPADPAKKTFVEQVSGHTLYEKTNPVHLSFPHGKLNLTGCSFTQEDERTVRVSGSKFEPSDTYTIKLEGAALVGYRCVCIAGIRDPFEINELDGITERVAAKVERDLPGLKKGVDYQISFTMYGINGVMQDWEPVAERSKEVGLLIQVSAKTQDIANTVCGLVRSASLHAGYEVRKNNAGNLAFPFSPAEFPAPPCYRFNIYHLIKLTESPLDMFPIKYFEIGGE